jgi:hypothetical protein
MCSQKLSVTHATLQASTRVHPTPKAMPAPLAPFQQTAAAAAGIRDRGSSVGAATALPGITSSLEQGLEEGDTALDKHSPVMQRAQRVGCENGRGKEEEGSPPDDLPVIDTLLMAVEEKASLCLVWEGVGRGREVLGLGRGLRHSIDAP